jgi:glucosamine kinase
VRLALRAADRPGELTPLLSELLGAFDHDPYRVVAWSEHARATDYAAFAPMVMRHANQGDPAGRRIAARAAAAIGDLFDQFQARGIDRLSLVGGLAEAITPWLTPDLRARLTRPDADAVAGALLVARGRPDLPKREIDRDIDRETDHEQAAKLRV